MPLPNIRLTRATVLVLLGAALAAGIILAQHSRSPSSPASPALARAVLSEPVMPMPAAAGRPAPPAAGEASPRPFLPQERAAVRSLGFGGGEAADDLVPYETAQPAPPKPTAEAAKGGPAAQPQPAGTRLREPQHVFDITADKGVSDKGLRLSGLDGRNVSSPKAAGWYWWGSRAQPAFATPGDGGGPQPSRPAFTAPGDGGGAMPTRQVFATPGDGGGPKPARQAFRTPGDGSGAQP